MSTRFTFLLFILLFWSSAFAQFYNGHQMTFGKSRVQYGEFYWQYFREPEFDVYFSIGGRSLSEYVRSEALDEIKSVENTLGVKYQGRIIFVLYNSLSDLRQSNIGINNTQDQYNIGGTKLIVSNRVLLYFNGDHNHLKKQIRSGVASLALRNVLHGGGGYKETLSSASTLEFPVWFLEGLQSYVAEPNDLFVEERLRILLFANKLHRYNRLTGFDAIVGGHILWKYLFDEYGSVVASSVLSLARATKNVEQSFALVLGMPMQDILLQMEEYYKAQYRMYSDTLFVTPKKTALGKTKKYLHYYNHSVSPTGDSILYIRNNKEKLTLELYIQSVQKRQVLKRWGNKLERISDFSYPIITWHPSGELISVFAEEKGRVVWYLYSFNDDEFIEREMHGFEKLLSAVYSPLGDQLLFTGIKKGLTDVFLYKVSSRTHVQLTNDGADEQRAIFSNDGSSIFYSSNQKENGTVGEFYRLYKIVEPFEANTAKVVSDDYISNNFPTVSPRVDSVQFISDRSGVQNLYSLNIDSVISAIDTAVHYSKRYSVEGGTSSQRHLRIGASSLSNSYYFLSGEKRVGLFGISDIEPFDDSVSVSPFRQSFLQKRFDDSLRQVQAKVQQKYRDSIEQSILLVDSLDINSYIFLVEAYPGSFYDSVFAIDSVIDEDVLPSVYQTAFYVNALVNQVDFGFLNQSYQTFTGGPVYFTPGMNVFFKMGVVDLFEDYQLTAGFRFSGTFDSNEYLFTLANFKKRWDKKYIFHRQSLIENASEAYNKVHDHEVMYELSYPFSEVSTLRFVPSARWDRITRLAVVNTDLRVPIDHRYRLGCKAEYVFDNTFRKGLNLYNGIRTKAFLEYYRGLNEDNGSLFVVGFDYRHYLKIYGGSIFAYRVASSTSWGDDLLLYYLGGVDNWINVFSNYPTYNDAVAYDKDKNWVYQTTASNLRGFNQNVLNGNTFALANVELRVPVVKMFVQRPMSSEFWSNLQAVGFADVGSAWTGFIPDFDEDAYNYQIVYNGPVVAKVDRQVDPLVAGFGWGLRSRIMGYFVRGDFAWGIEKSMIRPRIFYLSLSLDF